MRTRVGVLMVVVVATVGVAHAGYKFSGFTADGKQYETEYDGQVCTTGVVDESGVALTPPECHDRSADDHRRDYGHTRRARSFAGGRLRLKVVPNGAFVDVVGVDDQGASQLLIHHDTGKTVNANATGAMWWHTDKRVLGVEYYARRSVIGYDVSAPVARIEKALGPVDPAARALMWGGVWHHEGYGCTGVNVSLTFKKKGVLQAVVSGECMTMKLSGKKKGAWSQADDGTLALVVGGETTSCTMKACTGDNADADDSCLDCGGASFRQ